MVVLKKIKASTLAETMVATVLIVIIFMIASLTLNNVFRNTITYNTTEIETYLNKLEYQYQHKLIKLPYQEVYKDWKLSISQDKISESSFVLIEAIHHKNTRTIKRTIIF